MYGDGEGITVFAGGTILLPEIASGRLVPERALMLHRTGLDQLREFEAPGIMAVYAGVVVMVFAWWRLGRTFDTGSPPSRSALLTTLATWAAPLVVAPPLFSRDVYSYLAQGAMTGSGIDVYRFGPAVLGGPLAVEVPGAWQHAPAPYGPVFLFTSASITQVTSVRVVTGILAMRLLALLAASRWPCSTRWYCRTSFSARTTTC